MSRSPLSYPLTRMADGEAGGAADLQTDVMRFMAILAICLVAIFALVQSIPLDTAVPEEVVTPPQPEVVSTPVVTPAPRPEPKPEPAPEAVVVARPEPAPAPQPEPPAVPPREGFTLQFETDLALTRLAARNEVSLYAIGGEKSLRMSVNRGRLSFWPASTPNEFYEMEVTTVPEDVLAAFRRTSPESTQNVKWGVTLPARMQQQLNEYLEATDGGSLLIGANGDLRLEP